MSDERWTEADVERLALALQEEQQRWIDESDAPEDSAVFGMEEWKRFARVAFAVGIRPFARLAEVEAENEQLRLTVEFFRANAGLQSNA